MRRIYTKLFLTFSLLVAFEPLSAGEAEPLPVLTGTVTKVVDGDTIDVQLSSGPICVHLHGIDTPERGQPWAKAATGTLTGFVQGKEVDVEPFWQDRYDRMIGIVYRASQLRQKFTDWIRLRYPIALA